MKTSDPVAALREKLTALAANLWWTWQPEVRGIFRDLDLDLWSGTNHNPVEILDRLTESRWTDLVGDPVLHARVDRAFRLLQGYLGTETTWGRIHAGPLQARPVAYFCAEFGLYECLPIYSGGMGILAGDHLKSASDLGIPVVAVGMFYREGYFKQVLDREGNQQAEYTHNDPEGMPLDLIRGGDGEPLTIEVEIPERVLKVRLWNAAVGRCRLLLLDTDVPGNGEEGRVLSKRLYGGDQVLRLRQEILLGIAGMRALGALGIRPGVLHLNEGHCAFAIPELARAFMEESGCPFDEALREVADRTVFTTHTPVPAGHDWFPPDLVESHLARFRESLGLDREGFLDLGRLHPGRPDEPFCMTILGMRWARRTNAVSALNGRIARRMWQELWPGRTEKTIPIGHVTNGVHVGSWLAQEMGDLFSRSLGADWSQRLVHPDLWERIQSVDDSDLWSIHEILKVRLIRFLRRRMESQHLRWGCDREEIASACGCLDPSVLTVGFARRFATYKRATLLLDDAERFRRLVADSERPVQFVFAGKAHPNDTEGQGMIRRIVECSRDPAFCRRIVFIEDYDMNVGRRMVQGVDLWLNHPRRPLEASGTSGMKGAINGVLNVSVLDGWWPEAWDGENGFAVPASAVPREAERQDRLDRDGVFDLLEREAVPLFYERDENGLPRRWIARMKRSIRTLLWRFNADRMVIDYVRGAYLDAAGAATHEARRGG